MERKYLYRAEESKNSNESGIYRSYLSKEKGLDFLPHNVTSVYELVRYSCEKYRGKDALGYRAELKTIIEEKETSHGTYRTNFRFIDYLEILNNVHYLNAALTNLNFSSSKPVLFFASSCIEWCIFSYACLSRGIPVVAVKESCREEELMQIAKENQIETIFTHKNNYGIIEKIKSNKIGRAHV